MILLSSVSAVLPLTEELANKLFALSEVPGTVHGQCRMALPQNTWDMVPSDADDELAMEAMQHPLNKHLILFAMYRPELSDRLGQYFCTFFQHPVLTEFLLGLFGNSDFDVPVEITRSEHGMTVTIVDSHYVGLDGTELDIPFSADAGQPLLGTRPHDEAFLQRVMSTVYHRDQALPDRYGDPWILTASSFCEGIAMLAEHQRLTTVIDLVRFPNAAGPGLQTEEGTVRAAWLSQWVKFPQSFFTLYIDEEVKLVEHLRATLREYNVEPPAVLKRRPFVWQRYVTTKP